MGPNHLNSTSNYAYSPLPSTDSTRYFVLMPGEAYAPLICSLHTERIQDLPYYEAISSAWGSPKKSNHIICDGRTLAITHNLHEVLQRVRSTTSCRTLWADSICIDQDNKKEQGHQVALMGNIYSRANRTLIWLGLDDDGHGLRVTQLLDEVTNFIDAQIADYGSWDDMPRFEPKKSLHESPGWQSFKAMRESSWFSRLWVIQEAGLAREAAVLYGDVEMSWVALNRLEQWLYEKAGLLLNMIDVPASDMHQRRLWLPDPHRDPADSLAAGSFPIGATLMTLVGLSRYFDASDPRDHIYALLGSPQARKAAEEGIIIQPDYEKNYLDIYRDFVAQWVCQKQDLTFLKHVEHNSSTLGSSIPSWMPRWNLRPPTLRNIPGHSVSSSDFVPTMDPTGSLSVWAAMLGRISVRSDVLSMPDWDADEQQNPVIDIWKQISSKEPTDKQLFWFAQTLSCGEIYGQPAAYHSSLAAYCVRLCEESQISGIDLSGWRKDAIGGDAYFYDRWAATYYTARRFVTSQVPGEYELYALAPALAEEGDIICAIAGTATEFVIRGTAEKSHYKLIGPVHVEWPQKREDVPEEELILC